MGGRTALEALASTPHHQPTRTSDTQVQAILAARQTSDGVGDRGPTSDPPLDGHRRVAYAEVLADQTGRSAEAFLSRTVRWFAQRGTVVSPVC